MYCYNISFQVYYRGLCSLCVTVSGDKFLNAVISSKIGQLLTHEKSVIKSYSELINELCVKKLPLHENLIHPNLSKFLKQSHAIEVQMILKSVVQILTKIRRKFNMNLEPFDMEEVHSNIWKIIYPVLKKSLCTSLTISNLSIVSECASIMALILLENVPQNEEKDEDFEKSFKYFSNSPLIPPKFACSFVLNVLQSADERVEDLKVNVNEIVKVWIKGEIRLDKSADENKDILGALTTEIFGFDEFGLIKDFIPDPCKYQEIAQCLRGPHKQILITVIHTRLLWVREVMFSSRPIFHGFLIPT